MAKAQDFKLPKFDPSTVTLKVKITNEFKIRKAIALALINLAVWVMGFGLEIEE